MECFVFKINVLCKRASSSFHASQIQYFVALYYQLLLQSLSLLLLLWFPTIWPFITLADPHRTTRQPLGIILKAT